MLAVDTLQQSRVLVAPVHAGEHKGGIPRCQALGKGITYILQHGIKTYPRPFSLAISLFLTSKGHLPSTFGPCTSFFQMQEQGTTLSPSDHFAISSVVWILTTLTFRSSLPEQIQSTILQDVKGLKYSGVHTGTSHHPPPSHVTVKNTSNHYMKKSGEGEPAAPLPFKIEFNPQCKNSATLLIHNPSRNTALAAGGGHESVCRLFSFTIQPS